MIKEYSVDRIEGNILVCEHEGKTEDIYCEDVSCIKTGDIITILNGKVSVDKDKTEQKRKKILSLQNDLFE